MKVFMCTLMKYYTDLYDGDLFNSLENFVKTPDIN